MVVALAVGVAVVVDGGEGSGSHNCGVGGGVGGEVGGEGSCDGGGHGGCKGGSSGVFIFDYNY